MIERDHVRHAIERMATVWPVLANRAEMRDEIGRAVMAYADRLEVSDVENGTSLLVRTSKTAAKDGGPAWPPGPSEVTGCILRARADRLDAVRRPDGPMNTGPQRVVGRTCRCGGLLDYLAPERVLRCDVCRAVQVIEYGPSAPRIHLTLDEEQRLVFADTQPAHDDHGGIERAREFIARLQQEAEARASRTPKRSSVLAAIA